MPGSEPIEQTISSCLFRAAEKSSESLESRTKALQSLSSLTKVSSHNRALLAQSPGAIASIVSLLPSPDPLLQALSLSILFNLSLNPILKHPLASTSDLLRHLNSLLILSPGPPSKLAKLAASLVCSLAMLDKNKAALGVAGTVEAVVEAIGTSSAEHAQPGKHHLLSSLAELVQFHGNCTLAVRAGAVPVLVGIITSPCNEFAGSAYAILGLLARFEEGIAAVGAVDGVVELLVEGLRTGCMSSKESALDILVRLFERSEECVGEAAAKPELSSLLADLSVRGSVKVREKAGELMKVVMEANLDCYLEGNPYFLD